MDRRATVNRGAATYVYCLVADDRQPRMARTAKRPAGAGPVRFLELESNWDGKRRGGAAARRRAGARELRLWLVASDVPLSQYGEAAVNKRLRDIDWVARAAVAHESVVEAFRKADAILPMKLFTIFTSDDRALEHVRRQRPEIDRVLKRVMRHDEWGVRVVMNPARAPAEGAADGRQDSTGAEYLAYKKAQRDRAITLAGRARTVVADLHDRLAARSTLAKRRAAGELPVKGGPLLLDAAFLVPRSGVRSFRAAAAREARMLKPQGYEVRLSGPWPPYSFLGKT